MLKIALQVSICLNNARFFDINLPSSFHNLYNKEFKLWQRAIRNILNFSMSVKIT